MKDLSAILKSTREANKYSLNDVYKNTGIHDSTLSRIENGCYKEPPAGKLKTLAEFYGIDVISLYLSCGYLEKQDLSNYQRCFRGTELLTEEEINAIQIQIDLYIKNRGGDKNAI